MKKTQLYLLFLLLFFINIKSIAQTPLSGFIPGGDTIFLEKGETKTLRPVVFGGVKPAKGYTYSWYSIPSDINLNRTNSSILVKSTTSTSKEFNIFCKITDANGTSITLQQHILETDIVPMLVNTKEATLHAFATISKTLEILGDNSQSLSGYTVEISGSASSFVKEVSHADRVTYSLEAPMPGKYQLTFTLKDQNRKFISSLTRNIEVAPSSAQGMVILNSVYSYNDSQFYEFVLPGQEQIDSVQWKTDEPNSPFFGTEWKTDTEIYTWYNGNYYQSGSTFGFTVPGSYTRQCRIFLHDGRIIPLSGTFIVKNEEGISIGSVQGCVGDTVIVPATFKNLTNEYNITNYATVISYDSTMLFPIQVIPGKKVEAFSVQILDMNTMYASDNVLNQNIYEPGDTLYFLHFRILKKGRSAIVASHNRNRQLTYPGEIYTEDATFTVNNVPGIPMLYQLRPNNSSVNSKYTWTYGTENTLTSNEMSPVISHKGPGSNQEICLQIRGTEECFSKGCSTITVSPESLYSISGILENDLRKGIAGEVIAYLIKDGNYYPAGRDTVDANGSFKIENLAKGNYVLLGIPATSIYKAAYYFGEGLRANANTIAVTGNVTGINFMLDSRSVTPPASVISGSFQRDSTTIQHQTLFESFHGTLPSIIFLTNNRGEIVDWTKMGQNNNYTFSDPGNEQLLIASFGRVPDELTHNFILTSIAPAEEIQYKVYPNPFHQEIIIDCQFDFEAELYNFIGQKVDEFTLSKGKNEINLEHLDSGIYLLNTNGNKTLKIIKY
ncbi:MAG: T9SS type A sorting domain-containing protein [Sporocytophaga sp.]|uniref:T9SS type A sorting domain-containing protein n=1 Tax=Sporocytophaga sp. TaxID=2231183 RepID=UPI001B1A4F3F|nr:T9SS type A sorting domain-containing protein [Sporocytophaga sp.]MBO9702434.1 T9SS type A sorting domain-containing protein [Sporocytophaga sp.]